MLEYERIGETQVSLTKPGYSQDSQLLEYGRIDSDLFRVTVHYNAYQHQARAWMDVWTELGWKELVRQLPDEIVMGHGLEPIRETADTLIGMVLEIRETM